MIVGRDLDFEFSRSTMELTISQPKIVRLPRKDKPNISIDRKALNVTIGFDLALGLKCDHWVGPWP